MRDIIKRNICSIIMITLLSQQALVTQCTDYHGQTSSSEDDGSSPPNYQFQYAVNEGSSGNDFGHEEERNGHTTRGQYRVLLPDGRMQVVSYTADKNGYRAEVTYENVGGSGSYKGYSANPTKQTQQKVVIAPPPPPAQPLSEQGYSSSGSESGNTNSYSKRTSGSFVKLRRNIKGRNFNYAF